MAAGNCRSPRAFSVPTTLETRSFPGRTSGKLLALLSLETRKCHSPLARPWEGAGLGSMTGLCDCIKLTDDTYHWSRHVRMRFLGEVPMDTPMVLVAMRVAPAEAEATITEEGTPGTLSEPFLRQIQVRE